MYWGLYNIVERPDASFASSYLGGQKEDWFAANHTGPISGSLEKIKTFQDLFATLDDPADPEQYAAVKSFLDTIQFCDYVITNWYAGNQDWPDDNWYVGMRNPAGRINFFVWDGEATWDNGAKIVLGESGPNNMVKLLFETLIRNPDFKLEFADRLYKHLFNDGVLTEANAQARWLEINARIDRAIVGESARWGDTRYDPSLTRADWLKARDDVLTQMDGNVDRLVTLVRQAGYYPELDPPAFTPRRNQAAPEIELTMTASGGHHLLHHRRLRPACAGDRCGRRCGRDVQRSAGLDHHHPYQSPNQGRGDVERLARGHLSGGRAGPATALDRDHVQSD